MSQSAVKELKAQGVTKPQTNAGSLITEHLDLWTSAITRKNTTGRGSRQKYELYGIKRLRELILELAVRGKLVSQDPRDEPASELLKRIAQEKVRLLEEGKIKRPKKLGSSEISDDEKPFELPEGWSWCRLQDVSLYIQRGKGPTYADSGRVRVASQKCVQWSGFVADPARYVEDSSVDKYQEERFLLGGDLLLNSTGTGTVGRVCEIGHVEPRTMVADSHVTVIRLAQVTPRFIKAYLSAPGIQDRIDPAHEKSLVSGSTKQVELNTSSVTSLEVPTPPFKEQHRIIAKVDELMALCDQLENQTEQSLDAHATLAGTLLDALTQAQSADELAENWQRLEQNWDLLFPTSIAGERAIDKLKQTILQLAVMGKLVPQDPCDEPASELLKQIAAEKEHLLKEKKIKKQKPLPPISAEEKLFELPEGWEWCRLDEPALHSEAGWSPRCPGPAREGCEWGVLKVSAVTWGSFNSLENKALAKDLLPRPEYEVKPRDFLISRANTADLVARSVVVPDGAEARLMMSDKIIRFVFSKLVMPDYLSLVNNSSQSREYYAKVAGGTSSSMKNVSRSQIQMLVLGLPPKKEQKRILDKLGELIPLCDQLKQHMQAAQKAQVNFTDSVSDQAIRQTA